MLYGLNTGPDFPPGDPAVSELQELGVQIVRYTYKDFTAGDQLDPAKLRFHTQLLERMNAGGLKSMVILTYETYPGAPTPPVADAVWLDYIAKFVRRAGQIARALAPLKPIFQVWNEPDLPPHPEYIRTMSEAMYGQMLNRTYAAIKAVDANLPVITAGLGAGNPSWLGRVIQSLNGRLPADAFAIHPYGQRPTPTWPNPTWGFGYVGDLIDAYRRVTGLPLVISEIGVEHLTDDEQAEYLRRFFATITANYAPVIDSLLWFCYSDRMVSPYGLLNANDQRKPAWYGYRAAVGPQQPPPAGLTPIMSLKAIVNASDYENMVRNYWLKEDIPADLVVDGQSYPGGEIAFRGTTSLNYPKKGFKIKFDKNKLFQGNTQRLDLSASYADKSLIRERLSFDLFAKTGVVASKVWHVDFTILSTTGQLLFHGLYTGLEHPDKYFFRNRQREVGNLYKADGGSVNGVNVGATLNPQPDEVLKILYAKEESRKVVASGAVAAAIQKVLDWPVAEIADASETDYSDLTAFITQLNQWEPAVIVRYLETILDVESYLDWLAVNTLVQSNDSYHKNYYLHHRQEDNRWEIMPWDYDLSWGRNWNDYCGGLCDDLSEGTSIKGTNQMANQLSRRVLGSEALFQRLRTKLLALLETEFTQTSLYNKIDALYAQIASLAHQDSGKWPTDIQFEQERDRLKDWIRRRREFLFKELAQTPPPGPEKADTIVTKLETNPPAPVAGQAVTFIATVQNIGSATTGGAVGVAFQLNRQYLTYGLGGTLAAGATMTLTAVSTWTAVAGQYTLRAVVDDINRYPELSEANNILDMPFTVTAKPAPVLSDVTVLDIAFERLTAEQVRLAALVSNIGAAKTPDVVGVAFLVDDKFATYGTIDPLEPGESKAIRAVAPLNLTGQRRITAIADDINRFPEANESNNQLVEIIDFGTPAPKLADTVILSVSLGAAGRFTEGEAIYFEAQVKNIGTAITGNTVGVAFTLNGQYLTFGTTSPIEAEETRAIRAVSPWRAVAGQHRLVAVVDDVNRYPELSEANNRFELSFEVLKAPQLLPDSTVDDLGFEVNAAKQVILTATVSNIGTAGTPDVVGVAFFVDGVYRTYGIGPRMAIGSQATIKAVAALSLTGKHKVAAVVDDVNRYEELSHQNNRLERELNFVTTVERRAVWVTRYDWTRLGKTPAPDAIDQMVQKVAAAGFNTIFFQVRGAGDSYYTPGLEPWAARLTGTAWATLGQDPGWDPLDRLLTKAHAAGIEVHAYINVYSVWISPPDSSYGQLAPPASNPPHLFDRLTYGPGYAGHPGQYALGSAWRQHDEAAKPMPLQWNQILWASPNVDAVQTHTVAVIADVVTRYPVDGVHLDLVRYANRGYSYDPAGNAAAGAAKSAARDQWQRERVTALVREVYRQVKAIRPGTWLSAAVWPYYQNKWGWSAISEGYSDYYQDSKGWLAAGIADALAPMMYGAAADDLARWKILLADFLADSRQRHIYPGISADYEDFTAITQRIEAARAAKAPGHVLFSLGALEQRGYLARLAAGPYAQPVSLPPKPAAA